MASICYYLCAFFLFATTVEAGARGFLAPRVKAPMVSLIESISKVLSTEAKTDSSYATAIRQDALTGVRLLSSKDILEQHDALHEEFDMRFSRPAFTVTTAVRQDALTGVRLLSSQDILEEHDALHEEFDMRFSRPAFTVTRAEL